MQLKSSLPALHRAPANISEIDLSCITDHQINTPGLIPSKALVGKELPVVLPRKAYIVSRSGRNCQECTSHLERDCWRCHRIARRGEFPQKQSCDECAVREPHLIVHKPRNSPNRTCRSHLKIRWCRSQLMYVRKFLPTHSSLLLRRTFDSVFALAVNYETIQRTWGCCSLVLTHKENFLLTFPSLQTVAFPNLLQLKNDKYDYSQALHYNRICSLLISSLFSFNFGWVVS